MSTTRKRVLITGARGMLGQDLSRAVLGAGHEAIALGRTELDVSNRQQIEAVFQGCKPDCVIQAAAMTDVDGAEARPLEAFQANALGTRYVAMACHTLDVPLLYISTDYVFGGRAEQPYLEAAATGPLGVYGQSKLAGEQAVRELLRRFYIVRTAWLYGAGGKNFVDTMRRLGRSESSLRVVADQIGAPTWTRPLAERLVQLLDTGCYGTYHLSAQGATSWHGVAERIMALEGLNVKVDPISTAELNRPAPRPAYSVLANMNATLIGLEPLPHWEQSLAEYLQVHRWST